MGGGIFADQLSLNSPNFERHLKKSSFIDQIIVGEGENLFLKYLKRQISNPNRIRHERKTVKFPSNRDKTRKLSKTNNIFALGI